MKRVRLKVAYFENNNMYSIRPIPFKFFFHNLGAQFNVLFRHLTPLLFGSISKRITNHRCFNLPNYSEINTRVYSNVLFLMGKRVARTL